MKRAFLTLLIAAALPAFAVQAADKKEHPPEKAMDSATPEMKNPEGTDKLHPPQKAMDEATPAEKKSDASSGASTGTAGPANTPSWDVRKAGEGVTLTGK